MKKRIIVKIGTNTLTKNNSIDVAFISDIALQISELRKTNYDIIIVTSGAIGLGSAELGLQKSREVKIKQATAAIGQNILMEKYSAAFKKHNIKVAQLLLSYEDFSDRKRYLNLRNCIETLLKLGVVPIINENDPVSIDEIGPSFGDNDKLSALVASKVEADLLILMSDVTGLYDKNPKLNKDAHLIREVSKVDKKIEGMAGSAGSAFSVGGMKSKIEAAKICESSGCDMLIVDGREKNVIKKAISHEVGTLFKAAGSLTNKERWILHAKAKGTILIDEGAKMALLDNKSLLPAGIKKVTGSFSKNDIVEIDGFGKAIVDYSSEELNKIKGKKLDKVEAILGTKGHVVIKRENLVVM